MSAIGSFFSRPTGSSEPVFVILRGKEEMIKWCKNFSYTVWHSDWDEFNPDGTPHDGIYFDKDRQSFLWNNVYVYAHNEDKEIVNLKELPNGGIWSKHFRPRGEKKVEVIEE